MFTIQNYVFSIVFTGYTKCDRRQPIYPLRRARPVDMHRCLVRPELYEAVQKYVQESLWKDETTYHTQSIVMSRTPRFPVLSKACSAPFACLMVTLPFGFESALEARAMVVLRADCSCMLQIRIAVISTYLVH